MKFTIKTLKRILQRDFNGINKLFGVELVELGFAKYKKLNYENYYYWWYECENIKKANKKSCTYNWNDIELTRKSNFIRKYIKYHNDNENVYVIFTNILNIEAAKCGGINIKTLKSQYQTLIEFYYKDDKIAKTQLQLF